MLLLCNYYLTYKCNAYCEFCHFGMHDFYKETPFAQLSHFKENVDQMADLGVKFIDLTGGEPLLHKEIHLMAEYARGKKMQTSITTNGLLYHRFAEKLAGKINLLHFSLDSPDEEEHNKIRKVNCYKSVLKSIEIAKSLGEFPDILFTVTNETYHKLPLMHEIANRYELVLLVNPVFSYFGNPGLSEEAVDYIDQYTDGKIDVYLNKGFLKLRRNGGNDINNPKCKAVSRVIVISPYNEIILPCYHFGNEKIKIDGKLKELRQSERVSYFMKMEGKFDFCQGCTVNCYFEPSFAFPTNLYGIASLTSKFKYGYNKLVKQKLIRTFTKKAASK
ncbi:MAG: radical SAM protein [Ignavibacteriaceae bacterium]|nr:radical SAM protein [Ignavibacteriaceae bacterium]